MTLADLDQLQADVTRLVYPNVVTVAGHDQLQADVTRLVYPNVVTVADLNQLQADVTMLVYPNVVIVAALVSVVEGRRHARLPQCCRHAAGACQV